MLFCGRQRREAAEPLAALAQAGLVAQIEQGRRFALVTPECELRLEGPLRQALAAGRVEVGEGFLIEDFYPVELPGARFCGLIVQGNGAHDHWQQEGDYEATFSSGRMPPSWPSCPDPDHAHRLWQIADGELRLQPLPLLDQWPAKLEMPLRDAMSGRIYYHAVQYRGKCGQDSARLLTFGPDGQLLDAEAEVLQAFEQQCDLTWPDQHCLGKQSTSPEEPRPDPGEALARQLRDEFERFVSAVAEMDPDRLASTLQAGVLSSWRAELPLFLFDGGMSQPEVEQRLRWLKAQEAAGPAIKQ